MNLFETQCEEEKLHPNFKAILDETHKGERIVLQHWADEFPDRDKKFVQEFQTTFNSSFWELYLFKLFKELGFEFDWSFASPDFALQHKGIPFIVEATISNSAKDEIEEWSQDLKTAYDEYAGNMNEHNYYSIIRLANSFSSKLSKYKDIAIHKTCYKNLPHVKDKPFVIAMAPYEQPLFFHQYDRPIMALLYDYYVDEEEYLKSPEKFPEGLLGKSLEYVEKENGSMIMLGIFTNNKASEVSAVIFNPIATMGKVSNMKEDKQGFFTHVWLLDDNTLDRTLNEEELIEDGLFVFHNPYAKHPLPREVFDKERICQVFMDKRTGALEKSYGKRHLSSRTAINIKYIDKEEE